MSYNFISIGVMNELYPLTYSPCQNRMKCIWNALKLGDKYRQVSNIRRTLVGN